MDIIKEECRLFWTFLRVRRKLLWWTLTDHTRNKSFTRESSVEVLYKHGIGRWKIRFYNISWLCY